MKEIKTCEDYVLNELEEKKEEIRRLTKEHDTAEKVSTVLLTWLEKLKPFFTLRQGADGSKLIDMKYVFKDYDPEAFKILSALFDLEEDS